MKTAMKLRRSPTLEIGEKIMFIHQGKKLWEGNNRNIFNNKIKELDEFIFSNKLMKKIKP